MDEDARLLQPFNYLCRMPGKQIRSKLAAAFNLWLKIPEDKLGIISEVLEMLHNASLLIDDIEDNSILRRGIPTAHKIFGVASTINCGNFVYFKALEKIQDLGPDSTRIYTQGLLELHRGQGHEIWWRDNFQCPTLEEYEKAVMQKTGGLFELGVNLIQSCSLEKDVAHYSKLTRNLGLFFQVRDDFINLWSSSYSESKSFAEDFTEGKFSFPIIHAISTCPGGIDESEVFKILKQRTEDVFLKKYCISKMEALGSYAYTKKYLTSLEDDIRKQIEDLGGNKFLICILDKLSDIYKD